MSIHDAYEYSEHGRRGHFDHLDKHAIRQNVVTELQAHGSITAGLEYEQEYQQHYNPESYEILNTIGSYLIPLDEHGKRIADNVRHRVFVSGMLVALKAIEELCTNLHVSPQEFHEYWCAQGSIKIVGISHDDFDEMPFVHRYKAIGDSAINTGTEELRNLDTEFQSLITDVATAHGDMPDSELFQASYGYVFSGGVTALSSFMSEQHATEIIYEDNADLGVHYLLEDKITVELEADATICDLVDTKFFYDDESLEAILGQTVEMYLDIDDEAVEIANALAATMHQNDYRHEVLDEVGESFFYGAITGFIMAEQQCELVDIDICSVLKRWRKSYLHQKLDSETEIDERAIAKELDRITEASDVPFQFEGLVEKISDELDHDETEAAAYANGAKYAYFGLKEAIQECIRSKINQRAKLASASLDDEIARLLTL